MTKPLAMTFAIPKYSVGNGYCLIRYFKTMTVYSSQQTVHSSRKNRKERKRRTTLPAKPPARSANPRNSTNRAFQATPLPL